MQTDAWPPSPGLAVLDDAPVAPGDDRGRVAAPRPRPRIGAFQRLRAIVRSTPGRLTAALAVLVLLCIAYGVTAFTGTTQASAKLADVHDGNGPRTINAQSLYRALSDADATAAASFLSAGTESTELRTRYLNDIAAAGTYLANATAGVRQPSRALTTLATELPVYDGLVETARANDRLGYPLGAAYLREASGLMRNTLLPATHDVYDSEANQLASGEDAAGRYPYLAIALGVVTLAALILVQRYVARRTRRRLNVGLAAASVFMLGALITQNVGWASLHSHLHAARVGGSQQVEVFAVARIDALQARADEALTLVAHGSGDAFEADFQHLISALAAGDGPLATAATGPGSADVRGDATRAAAAVASWQKAHEALHKNDTAGKYSDAVGDAIGGPAEDAFHNVDTELAGGITHADETFRAEAHSASGPIHVVGIVVLVLALAALAGVGLGLQRRIAEYR